MTQTSTTPAGEAETQDDRFSWLQAFVREYVAVALEHAKQRYEQPKSISSQEWWRGHRDALAEVLRV